MLPVLARKQSCDVLDDKKFSITHLRILGKENLAGRAAGDCRDFLAEGHRNKTVPFARRRPQKATPSCEKCRWVARIALLFRCFAGQQVDRRSGAHGNGHVEREGAIAAIRPWKRLWKRLFQGGFDPLTPVPSICLGGRHGLETVAELYPVVDVLRAIPVALRSIDDPLVIRQGEESQHG